MRPTVKSSTSFLARASPIHCLFPTPKGTRAGCFLYLDIILKINLRSTLHPPPIFSNEPFWIESVRVLEVIRVSHDEL